MATKRGSYGVRYDVRDLRATVSAGEQIKGANRKQLNRAVSTMKKQIKTAANAGAKEMKRSLLNDWGHMPHKHVKSGPYANARYETGALTDAVGMQVSKDTPTGITASFGYTKGWKKYFRYQELGTQYVTAADGRIKGGVKAKEILHKRGLYGR